MNNIIKSYLNKTIKGFKFSEDIVVLLFEDSSSLVLSALGGCCSKSWFETLSGEEDLEGAILQNLELIEYENKRLEIEEDYSVIKFYGVKITTNRGYTDIDMRNESNGYYGGYIGLNTFDQYNGEHLHADY